MRRLLVLIGGLPADSAFAAVLDPSTGQTEPQRSTATPATEPERVVSVSEFRSFMTDPDGPLAQM